MSAFLEDQDRNVIPRWRDFRSTVEMGELDIAATKRETLVSIPDLTELSVDWQQNRSRSFAGDLISAALVSGNLEVAREAAEYIISSDADNRSPLNVLAQRVLSRGSVPEHFGIESPDLRVEQANQPSKIIATARKRLVEHPHDAILWMDLAYMYAVRGINDKAERAVKVALGLAPLNRFVLRSAARFFVHRNRLDIAHDLIRNSPRLRYDPWLLAAEVSIALSAKRSPRSVKEGLELVNSGNFPNGDITELTSAIGTLEFNSGSNSKAKKLFRKALLKPNDNSLAQAKWISKEMNGLQVDVQVRDFQVARPFEATAYESYARNEWARALECSLKWLGDQPFSSRPAALASFLASGIFENFAHSEAIAKFGLVANPNDPSLRLTLAFSYASLNMPQDAIAELNKLKNPDSLAWVDAGISANRGLVAFREGNAELGRKFYSDAVEITERSDDNNNRASALLYWAQEEAKFDDGFYERLVPLAEEAVKKSSGFSLPFLLNKVRSLKG
jgi:tetratricopeptide (TPR) repeat protein